MYDKVSMFLPKMYDTPDISKYLDHPKEMTDKETGDVKIFGGFEGLSVNSYPSGISITGSLAKFQNPSNIYPLDIHTTAEALEKLSEGLHIDVSEANVTSLEYGTNFSMKKPVETYLGLLGDMPRHKRLSMETSLYYQTGSKTQSNKLVFYDKIRDAKRKGLVIPDGFENTNLLKYEMRLHGHLRRLLKVEKMPASALYDRDIYRKLASMWKDYYFSIRKQHKINIVMTDIKTVSDAEKALLAILISQNRKQADDFLDSLKQNDVFKDKKYYSRLNRRLNNIASNENFSVANEDVKELDDEVKNAVAYI